LKAGQYITFMLDVWRPNHQLQKVKAKILDFCEDPMKFHETKCTVEIEGEGYGIPISEVLEVSPADGEQLKLELW